MPNDLERLEARLRAAFPDISIAQQRATPDVEDDRATWSVRHPRAMCDVQVASATGELPFTVESELAPPVPARSIDEVYRLVVARLGLGIGG